MTSPSSNIQYRWKVTDERGNITYAYTGNLVIDMLRKLDEGESIKVERLYKPRLHGGRRVPRNPRG